MEKDKKLAQDLLRVRGEGFPSPLVSILGTKRVHILRYAVIGGLIFMLWTNWSDFGLRGFLLFGLGLIVGGILNEMGFLKRIGSNWTFTEKVTNWNIVSQLAGEQDDTDNPFDTPENS
ncbi:MAG: hypothetical protein AAF558_16130 [Verrucomicrobiota bacterium]